MALFAFHDIFMSQSTRHRAMAHGYQLLESLANTWLVNNLSLKFELFTKTPFPSFILPLFQKRAFMRNFHKLERGRETFQLIGKEPKTREKK